jgi:protein-tyrosine phosphatase
MNVLFVCSGNICRSPMAKVLYDDMITKNGLPDVADSAGLRTQDGLCASVPAVRVMAEVFGLSLAEHRSKALTPELVDWADLIVCMTNRHVFEIRALYPQVNAVTLAQLAGRDFDIADPFGGSDEVYRTCAQTIDGLLSNMKRC